MDENRIGLLYLGAWIIGTSIAVAIILWKSAEQGISGSMIGLALFGTLVISFFVGLLFAFLFSLRHPE